MAGLGVTLTREDQFLCGKCGHSGQGITVQSANDTNYHMQCAILPSFVRLDSTLVVLDLHHDTDIATAETWISGHNQRFKLPLKTRFLACYQRLKTPSSPTKRVLLEAFKYLAKTEIALSVGYVCREWYFTAWNGELWEENRLQWLFHWATSCFHCEQVLRTEEEIGLKCPSTHRFLCVKCRNSREMMLISPRTFCSLRGISLCHARHFQVPGLQLRNTEVIYMHTAARRLQSLRHSHRRDLLSQLARSKRLTRGIEKTLLGMRIDRDFDQQEYQTNPYRELIRSVLTLEQPRTWPAKLK